MASVELATEQLMKTVHDETMRAFEGIKLATHNTIQNSSKEAKSQFYKVLSQATAECEAIGKSMDKEIKKAIHTAIKEYSQTVSDTEKETIRLINDISNNTKTKLNEALHGAKSVLGKHIKELEKILKELNKTIEKEIGESIKLIREYAKTTLAQLNELNQQYSK